MATEDSSSLPNKGTTIRQTKKTKIITRTTKDTASYQYHHLQSLQPCLCINERANTRFVEKEEEETSFFFPTDVPSTFPDSLKPLCTMGCDVIGDRPLHAYRSLVEKNV